MSKKSAFVYFTLSFLLLQVLPSCNSNHSANGAASTNDSINFFSCNNFILNDLKDISQTPYFLYKIEKVKSKKDSTVIDTIQLKNLANYFLQFDISTASKKKWFKETSFEDLSTESYTIMYNNITDTSTLKSETFLFDSKNKDHLKSIYFHRLYYIGDTLVSENAHWKYQQSFTINQSKKIGQQSIEQSVYVHWNDKNSAKF